ncbi:MAG: ABC transporter ATP-binding protein [Anaerolineaceae bacterium]|nr:ABC transporter ATP-binding protein [Anaerolineaceae bacterium]
MNAPLLSVRDLSVQFHTYAGKVHAVNGMSFDIDAGDIFGLVGESGCGKSVTGMAITRMIAGSGRITGGQVLFHGEDLLRKTEQEMQSIRGKRIAMVFQDPTASLNPVFSVGNQITRIIRQHTGANAREARARALAMFESVALPDPERIFRIYPHELSGGMQQRVMIAMALASGAELLIADEPTTALDVTIQAQILRLLVDLRDREGISILLITHNLGVVSETCNRVAVAYAGKIVESGLTDDVLQNMKHPYTQGLLAALPSSNQRGQDLVAIPGNVPNGLATIAGCPFHPRCGARLPVCSQVAPAFIPIGAGAHQAACHLYTPGEQSA